ncbi:ead/Ea22-like family protein [Citrobacter sp. Cb223]|uniref:ead/Ea22-like family protein n=1 Tax=Citrobacter sp. Cb223 TaxID=2985035 RepID=UPI00336BFA14
MTALNKQALRVLAVALDGGDWHAEGNSVYGGRYDVGDNVCYDHIASCESVNGESPHADFIAAANPATVLALLDELEAKDKSIGFLKDQLAQLANFNPDWDRLEAATDSLSEHMAKLSAAEKRIAELESNEIREEGNQFLVVRHPGKTPVIKHLSGDPEEFLRNLIEQDPLVTIDIITHRYYGVGGQWVQDADEYLHMMTATGIGVKGD